MSSVYVKPGEPEKLWFNGDDMDLFIWVSESGEIIRFQLSYHRSLSEKSLLWDSRNGILHAAVDDGARPGKHPSAPILADEIPCDKLTLVTLLNEQSGDLSREHLGFIQEKINSWRPVEANA